MKKRSLTWAFLALALLSAPLSAALAETPPLMTISFPENEEERKPYAGDLSPVVQKALDANPQAVFKVEAVVPVKGPRRQDKRTKRHASAIAREVMGQIQAAGVDENRIGIGFKHDPAAEIIKVRILVE